MGRRANERLNVLIVYHFLFQKSIRQLEKQAEQCECPTRMRAWEGRASEMEPHPTGGLCVPGKQEGSSVSEQDASKRPASQGHRRKDSSGKESLPVFTLSHLSAASLITFSISFRKLCLFLATAISFTKQGVCVWEQQAGG